MRNTLFRFALLFTLMVSVTAHAQSVHEYHLKNGLTLLVKEDHRAPVVFSSVWYKVGGSYEHDGITGISHVLEHMMFRGSRKYPAGMLEKLISDNGGDQNAMTGNDQTVYYERISSDKLPLTFQIESDRMHNLLLKQSDFEKEIQVVMEERRMRFDDNPNALTYERFMAAAFVNNPYHHQAIGWMTDLEHMTIQDVRRWYHTWYVPNNAIVVVVGDVQPEKVFALAKKYFEPIPSSSVPALKPRTEIPSLGTKQVDVNIPAKLPLLFEGYQVPTLTTEKNSEKPYALDVLASLLGGSDSSRFARNLVRGKQIASFAQVSYDPYQLHSALIVFVGVPAQGHSITELQSAFDNEVKQLQEKPVTPSELERVKAQVIAGDVYKADSLVNQAFDLGTPESIGLSWRNSQIYVSRIEAVTAQQIQEAAKQYLISRGLTITVLHPTGAPKQSGVDQLPSSGLR